MKSTPQPRTVADRTLQIRIPDKLKNEFQKAIDAHGDEFSGKMTNFCLDAIKAFVLQTKRKEKLASPLEFVSDKSSDKIG